MATVTLDLGKLNRMSAAVAESGIREALGEAEARLKGDILNRPGKGRIYGKHQASAPGAPPAPDTGALRANTNASTQLREDGGDLVGSVVANTDYAEGLERGTERVAARPYLGLLKTQHAGDLQKAFVRGAKRGSD